MGELVLYRRVKEVPYLKSEQKSLFPVKSDEKKKKKCGLTPSHKVNYSGSCPAVKL